MTSRQKPFAPAAERNRHAILDVLRNELTPGEQVLEVGSGTGQHICHFAAQLPDVQWLPSDRAEQLAGIAQWIDQSGCDNIASPIALELGRALPALPPITHCYSANTLHIMHWPEVQELFALAGRLLQGGGKLIVYGPFSLNGDFGSAGNLTFDAQLRASDPGSGIREILALDQIARTQGLAASRRIRMPANNYLLIWQRCMGRQQGPSPHR